MERPVESVVYFNPVTASLSPVSSPRLAWPALAGGRARGPKAWLPAVRAGGRPSSPNFLGLRIVFPLAGGPAGRKNRRIWLSAGRSPLRPGQWCPRFSFFVPWSELAALRPICDLATGSSQGRPRRRRLKNAFHGRRPALHVVSRAGPDMLTSTSRSRERWRWWDSPTMRELI